MSKYTFELWRDIDFDTRYQVSSFGRVKWKDGYKIGGHKNLSFIPEHLLSQHLSRQKYYAVRIGSRNNDKHIHVHRLMVKAFYPDQNQNLHVNHKDGNKLNNFIHNLELVTPSENRMHAARTGLTNIKGERNRFAKLNEEQVKEIRLMYSQGVPEKEIAIKFNIHRTTANNIKNHKNWNQVRVHVGKNIID